MNLKAIMFAGLGLGISVALTSWWVGNDMANIRAAQEAKLAQCEQLRAQLGATPGAAGQGAPAIDPVTGEANRPVAGEAAAPDAAANPAVAAQLEECPEPEAAAPSQQGDPAAADPYADPATAAADPYADPAAAADPYADPAAAADPYADPAAAADPYADPAASGGYVDPAAPDPYADPYADPAAAAEVPLATS